MSRRSERRAAAFLLYQRDLMDGDFEPLYINCFPPHYEQRKLAMPLCGNCCVQMRLKLVKNTPALVDRYAGAAYADAAPASRKPIDPFGDLPW